MNVSIATVAEDVGTTVTRHPDGHHAVHPGDGRLMITGRQDRHHHRPAPRVLHRVPSSTRAARMITALAPSLPVLLLRLVAARGHRRGADPAGHRRAGRRQLPARGPPASLRADRRRGGDRRSPSGRCIGGLVTTYCVLALGLRRRGRGHRPACSSSRARSRTRRVRRAPAARPRRRRALRRLGLALIVLGVLALGRVGLGPVPKEGGTAWLGLSPTRLAHAHRRPRAVPGSSCAG